MGVTGLMKIGQHAWKQPSAHSVCESQKARREGELKSKLGETDIPEGCIDRVAYECVKKKAWEDIFWRGHMADSLKSHTLVFTQRGWGLNLSLQEQATVGREENQYLLSATMSPARLLACSERTFRVLHYRWDLSKTVAEGLQLLASQSWDIFSFGISTNINTNVLLYISI